MFKKSPFKAISWCLATLSILLFAATAQAQDYPNRTLKLIVPFAAGGTTDLIGRLVAQHLGQALNQTIIVENKAGAGGVIGATAALQPPPDGYTLFMGTAELFGITEHMTTNLPYSPERDFSPIGLVAKVPSVFAVNPKVPAKTMKEFIALAKANPHKFNFGSPGTGTNIQLIGELLKARFGLDITHIPYKGGAPAITDLVGGQIEMMPAAVSALAPFVKNGHVRALAVTSAKRSPTLPDVPTMAEAGVPDFVVGGWFGVFAKAGTPQPIVKRLQEALASLSNDAAFGAAIAKAGGEGDILVGKPFADFVADETSRWRTVVMSAGIKPAN